jgi:hypothetical protein
VLPRLLYKTSKPRIPIGELIRRILPIVLQSRSHGPKSAALARRVFLRSRKRGEITRGWEFQIDTERSLSPRMMLCRNTKSSKALSKLLNSCWPTLRWVIRAAPRKCLCRTLVTRPQPTRNPTGLAHRGCCSHAFATVFSPVSRGGCGKAG